MDRYPERYSIDISGTLSWALRERSAAQETRREELAP